MTKNQSYASLVIVLLAAFFLRTYRLLDFPLYGDEVDGGDIALDILHGHLAPFYPLSNGHEALYSFSMAPFFALLGDSVIANRFPSVVWSMIFVALMSAFGRVLFSSRRNGVLCAALAASLWWSVVFGRLGLRTITMPVMMMPALIGLVCGLRERSDRRALLFCIMGGVFAGGTSYTYTASRGFPVVPFAFLIFAALVYRERLRLRWRAFAAYVLLMVGTALPLYVYLFRHPDYDVRVKELADLSGFFRGDFSTLGSAIAGTAGMFTISGESNWVYNISGRPVFPGVEGWIFYIGIALVVWRWHKPEFALQLIVIATMLLPTVLTEHPPSWTRSIGALPAVIVTAVIPVEIAWTRLARFSRSQVAYSLLVACLGISIYTRTAFDMFDSWITNPGVYWMTLAFYDGAGKYIHQSRDTTPVNYVMDVFTDWRKHNVERAAERPDIPLRFSLQSAFVFPDDPRGVRVAFQIFGDPASALESTFLSADHLIYTDPRSDPQGNRPLQVFLISRAQLNTHLKEASQLAVDQAGADYESFQVGNSLQFLGDEVLNPAARAGQEMDVLSYWRVLRTPPDLAIFLHLLDSNNKVIAQYDGFDVIPSDLKPGDIVVELHALNLPADLPPALYRFEIGAYTRSDLQRIPLSSGDDHMWLQTWEIQK